MSFVETPFALFIEDAPVAVAMFDRQMCYLQVSTGWRRDYGLGDRQLRGLSHYEVFPEIPEHWKKIHGRGLAGEVLQEDRVQFDRADGSVQWLRWGVRPWYESKGSIGGIVIFSEDITARVRAEEELRLSEERYRCLVEANSDIVWNGKRIGDALRGSEERLSLAQEVAKIGSFDHNMITGETSWSSTMAAIYGLRPGRFSPKR